MSQKSLLVKFFSDYSTVLGGTFPVQKLFKQALSREFTYKDYEQRKVHPEEGEEDGIIFDM